MKRRSNCRDNGRLSVVDYHWPAEANCPRGTDHNATAVGVGRVDVLNVERAEAVHPAGLSQFMLCSKFVPKTTKAPSVRIGAFV